MSLNHKYGLIIQKLTICFLVLLSTLTICYSTEDKEKYVSEKYKFYFDNRDLKDSIIKTELLKISKDENKTQSLLLLGMIYMNEYKFDSAIIYLKDVNGLHLENFDKTLHFHAGAAFLLLDAYSSYKFKEIFDVYHLYWPFLQQDEHKDKLAEFDDNLRKNIRWWFIDYTRQVAMSEFNQSPDSYIFGYASESNYESLQKDNDANRLIQNRTEKGQWASVMMLPTDSMVNFTYCFYFNDFKLTSFVQILKKDFGNSAEFTKDKIHNMIKPINGKYFIKEKESFNWKSVGITMDSGDEFEVLMYDNQK